MYCRNYTGTASCVLCREDYFDVSLFGRVHYQSFHCIHTYIHPLSGTAGLLGNTWQLVSLAIHNSWSPWQYMTAGLLGN